MQIHVAIMENGFLLSTIERTPDLVEEPEFDLPPEERRVPAALRPKAAKVRSSVIKEDHLIVSTLRTLLDRARDKHDPDEPPLVIAGGLFSVDDGAAAVLFFSLADRGVIVRYEYRAEPPAATVIEHERENGERLDVSLFPAHMQRTGSECYVFSGAAETTDWLKELLERFQAEKTAREEEAEAEDD